MKFGMWFDKVTEWLHEWINNDLALVMLLGIGKSGITDMMWSDGAIPLTQFISDNNNSITQM